MEKSTYNILLIIVIGSILILSVMAVLKPTLLKNIIQYKDAHFIEYPDDTWRGIIIPDDAKLYFLTDVDSINNLPDLLTSRDGDVTGGRYNPFTKKIYVVDNLTYYVKEDLVRHEIAHHYYYNRLTKEEKKDIKKYYKRVCDDSNEFFAYMVGDGKDIRNEINNYFELHQNEEK